MFVMFCVHMYSFDGLTRQTLPQTFNDTAITDRHSDTTIFQLRAHWVRISWSIGSEKIVQTCAPGGSRTLDFLRARRAPYPLGQALCLRHIANTGSLYIGSIQPYCIQNACTARQWIHMKNQALFPSEVKSKTL